MVNKFLAYGHICEDDAVQCDKVKFRCNEPGYKKQMEYRCRKTCGFCSYGCVDRFTFCKYTKGICNNVPTAYYYCASTCNLCGLANIACRDLSTGCINETEKCRQPGNEFMMKQQCAKTCGFC